MNIQVHGDNIGVTPALQDFVDKKMSRLDKYFDAPPEREIAVTMAVEGETHRVEVTMQLHGVTFRAEEESADMYASISMVVDKLEQQVHRYKDKLNKRFRDKGLRTRIKHSVDVGAFQQTATALEEPEPQIARVKRFPMKPMLVDEAIMQMDLLGHDFFVFTNADTDEMNVVYKRRTGNYGLIEPQE